MRHVGAILMLIGFVLVILRAFGVWGNAIAADGGLLFAFIILGVGVYLTRDRDTQ